MVKPIHSNIKVGTIVSIMRVNNEHLRKIDVAERKYDYFKSKGYKTEMLFAEIELKKERDKYAQFLDFYI